MKNHYLSFRNRTLLIILSAVLFFVFTAKAQSFQIKWGMDNTLAGVSSHANFNVSNAALFGGSNTFALNSQYSTSGAIGAAYTVKPWPANLSSGRYMDFKFSANQYEYHINSLSFRLRRSSTGPKQVKIRSSADNFSSDLYTLDLVTQDKFYSVSLPLSFMNLANTNFSFRFYGYNPGNTTLGVLWFDEIIINGLVSNFVLPVDITYFNANPEEKSVNLTWETSWEKNSKEFVVERSTDLIEFKSIGKLEAGGDATGRLQYKFVDEAPFTGVSYYRLKMVDNDSNYNYSGNRDVVIKSNSDQIMITPNPASASQIRIIKDNIDPSALILTNIFGQNIYFNIVDFKDSYINIYPYQPLSPGLYILSLLQNGRKLQAKVLVP